MFVFCGDVHWFDLMCVVVMRCDSICVVLLCLVCCFRLLCMVCVVVYVFGVFV